MMFPRQEEQQLASLTRKQLGPVGQRASGEFEVQKWTHTRQCLPTARHGSDGLPAVMKHVEAPELGLPSGGWQAVVLNPKTQEEAN